METHTQQEGTGLHLVLPAVELHGVGHLDLAAVDDVGRGHVPVEAHVVHPGEVVLVQGVFRRALRGQRTGSRAGTAMGTHAKGRPHLQQVAEHGALVDELGDVGLELHPLENARLDQDLARQGGQRGVDA